MVLDLEKLKENLDQFGETLLNKDYLSIDMKTLYDFFSENPDQGSENINSYFSDYGSFDLMEFTLRYLKDIIHKDLSYTIEETGEIRLIQK